MLLLILTPVLSIPVSIPSASLRDRATLPSPQAVSALRAGIPRASVRFADCALRLPGGSLRSPPPAWPPLSRNATASGFSRHRDRRSRCLAGPGRLRRHRVAPRLADVRIRERRLAAAAPRPVRSRAAAAALRFRFRNRSPRRSVPWVGSFLRPSAARLSHPTQRAALCVTNRQGIPSTYPHDALQHEKSRSCRAGLGECSITAAGMRYTVTRNLLISIVKPHFNSIRINPKGAISKRANELLLPINVLLHKELNLVPYARAGIRRSQMPDNTIYCPRYARISQCFRIICAVIFLEGPR